MEDEVSLQEPDVVSERVVEEVRIRHNDLLPVPEAAEGGKETNRSDLGRHYFVEILVGFNEGGEGEEATDRGGGGGWVGGRGGSSWEIPDGDALGGREEKSIDVSGFSYY